MHLYMLILKGPFREVRLTADHRHLKIIARCPQNNSSFFFKEHNGQDMQQMDI